MATMARLTDRLKGIIGDRTADALAKVFGMQTVEDLLRHYPRRYVVRGEFSDISGLLEGDEVTVLAEIAAVKTRRANGRNILEVNVTDGSAVMSLTFFNQPWREKELKIGKTGMFAGKVGSFNGKRQLSHPDYQLIPDGDDVDSALAAFAGKYLPVYPAGGKMPSWKISQCVELVLDSLDEVDDYLPESVITEFGYPTLKGAFTSIHKPESIEAADLARLRLTFDEAILLQLLLAGRRAELKELDATPRKISTNGLVNVFEAKLPFKYTSGQVEVNTEIENDMQQPHPMHRLLQGEVGSGKTVIALRAMLSVIESGGQAALLAPTEVLATQHFKTIAKLLGDLAQAGTLQGSGEGTQLALLTGSMTTAQKREALGKISNGEAGIVIGTHALISEGVEFDDVAHVFRGLVGGGLGGGKEKVLLHGLAGGDGDGFGLSGKTGEEDPDLGGAGRDVDEAEFAGLVGEGFELGALDGHPGVVDVLVRGHVEDAALDGPGGRGGRHAVQRRETLLARQHQFGGRKRCRHLPCLVRDAPGIDRREHHAADDRGPHAAEIDVRQLEPVARQPRQREVSVGK